MYVEISKEELEYYYGEVLSEYEEMDKVEVWDALSDK